MFSWPGYNPVTPPSQLHNARIAAESSMPLPMPGSIDYVPPSEAVPGLGPPPPVRQRSVRFQAIPPRLPMNTTPRAAGLPFAPPSPAPHLMPGLPSPVPTTTPHDSRPDSPSASPSPPRDSSSAPMIPSLEPVEALALQSEPVQGANANVDPASIPTPLSPTEREVPTVGMTSGGPSPGGANLKRSSTRLTSSELPYI